MSAAKKELTSDSVMITFLSLGITLPGPTMREVGKRKFRQLK